MLKLKIGDRVIIITGNYKGQNGIIKKILKKKNRIIISGINIVKKHIKPTSQKPKGKIIKKEGSLHISNVAILDPNTNQASKIEFKIENGKKIRILKKSKKKLEQNSVKELTNS